MSSTLGALNAGIKQGAGKSLWHWQLCGNCSEASSCSDTSCPWHRPERLDRFWTLYQRIGEQYLPHRMGRKPALNSHEDLLEVIETISAHPNLTKLELLAIVFKEDQNARVKPPDLVDQMTALNMAASIKLLMDIDILHDDANLADGNVPVCPWRDKISIKDFIAEAFPVRVAKGGNSRFIRSVTASELINDGKLRLRPTNDIRRHLVMNHEDRVVWIFQQESALREMLKIPQEVPQSGHSNSITLTSMRAHLPRALILELLDTIHEVLFPISKDSHDLRTSLVERHNFDKGLITYISKQYRSPDDPDISYTYFADRLEALNDELQQPAPHGRMQRWLTRRTNTYMLMATMIGVFVAVVLGFLGLLVSTFQAYVAYQQWKHPLKIT